MSGDFQTAVRRSVPLTARYQAIDRLVQTGRSEQLRVLVQTDNLASELRRHALSGLLDCNAESQLRVIADDRSLHPTLRRRAEEAT